MLRPATKYDENTKEDFERLHGSSLNFLAEQEIFITNFKVEIQPTEMTYKIRKKLLNAPRAKTVRLFVIFMLACHEIRECRIIVLESLSQPSLINCN